MTTEQMLLINNLMSMTKPRMTEGKEIKDWIDTVNVSKLDDKTSQEQWKAMIDAVKSDSELMSMKIVESHKFPIEDNNGGGYGVVLVSGKTKEAAVVFSGTTNYEWKDNFDGGGLTDAADHVSTKQQEEALKWYREQYDEQNLGQYNVTVTGHSKGGNKAKYITLMDDTVDQCVSFDGQGFSDEFIDVYADRIVLNQHKIQNHNLDNDFVNILLNDVGETTYYKGNKDEIANFGENHCLDSFFHRDKNGKLTMKVNPKGQSKEMKALDQFLNSILRSMSPEDKKGMLNMIGTLVQAGADGDGNAVIDVISALLSDSKNAGYIAYFLAYIVQYQEAYPELMGTVKSVLGDFGLDELFLVTDVVAFLMEHDIIRFLAEHGRHALAGWLWIHGFRLSAAIVEIILSLLALIEPITAKIKIKKNDGKDKKVGGAKGGIPADFSVMTGAVQEAAQRMNAIEGNLENLNAEIEAVEKELLPYTILRLGQIRKIKSKLNEQKYKCSKLERSLNAIYQIYERHEESIINEAAGI